MAYLHMPQRVAVV